MFTSLLDCIKDNVAISILLGVILVVILFFISRGLYRFFSKLISDTPSDKILLGFLNEYLKKKNIKKLGIIKKIILKNDTEKDYFGKDIDLYINALKYRFLKNIEYRARQANAIKRENLVHLYMCLYFISIDSFKDILIAKKRYLFIKRFLNILIKNKFLDSNEAKIYLSKYKHEYHSILCDSILLVYIADGFEKQKLILLKNLE